VGLRFATQVMISALHLGTLACDIRNFRGGARFGQRQRWSTTSGPSSARNNSVRPESRGRRQGPLRHQSGRIECAFQDARDIAAEPGTSSDLPTATGRGRPITIPAPPRTDHVRARSGCPSCGCPPTISTSIDGDGRQRRSMRHRSSRGSTRSEWKGETRIRRSEWRPAPQERSIAGFRR